MGWSWLPVRAGIDDLEREFLELGEQRPYLPRVVEQGLPVGGLGHGEPAGDGPAVYLAGPFGVGAVQGGRVAVASAGRLAAGVGADGEGAGQGGPGRFGELGGDLVQGRALGWACVHATHRLRSAVSRTVHSIFLWTVRAGRPDGRGGDRDGRLYHGLAPRLGAAAGSRVRPGGRRAGSPGPAGAGEEPAVGRGKARQ